MKYFCVTCRRECQVLKIGVGVDFGNGHVYPGDLIGCPDCGQTFVASNNQPVNDRKYTQFKMYFVAKEADNKEYHYGSRLHKMMLTRDDGEIRMEAQDIEEEMNKHKDPLFDEKKKPLSKKPIKKC
jgi:hypothetical protein